MRVSQTPQACMLLQLHARSGMLQNIAAGDSILAPFGKAWCQIPDDASSDELAVLTLLVPGSLPNAPELSQQGKHSVRQQ